MIGLFAAKAKDTTRYAGFSISRRGDKVEVNIDHVDVARTIFLKQIQSRYKPLVALLRSAFGHRVMIVADADPWRRTSEAMKAFFAASHVTRTYGPVIDTLAQETFAAIAETARPAAPVDLDVERVMRRLTCRILGFVLFGEALGIEDAAFAEDCLDRSTRVIDHPVLTPVNFLVSVAFKAINLGDWQPVIFPKDQRQTLTRFMNWLSGRIDASRARAIEAPLLAALEARYQALPPKRRRTAICAEYAMLFIAGIETTAAALTFALAEIANDPALIKSVTDEARSGSAAQPTIAAVLQETLRRHTIVPTMLRVSARACPMTAKRTGAGKEAAELVIPKGAVLRYLPVLNHMRRSLWKDPYSFRPERHAALTGEQKKAHQAFGLGPQSCPGRALATHEAMAILTAVLRHLDVVPQPLTEAIATERNAVFTMRPVDVRLRVSAAV